MKFLLLIALAFLALLIWIAESDLNARCYKTNHDLTTICHYSDGRVEIYQEVIK